MQFKTLRSIIESYLLEKGVRANLWDGIFLIADYIDMRFTMGSKNHKIKDYICENCGCSEKAIKEFNWNCVKRT